MGREFLWGVCVFAFIFGLISLCLYAVPKYNVWQKELSGLADLKKAESDRRIAVYEAEAKKDSATLLAIAEVERAKGVAEANKIIGESLKENEAYLRSRLS
jgi:hypothetical protein